MKTPKKPDSLESINNMKEDIRKLKRAVSRLYKNKQDMKPTKEIIDKAARRGALIQDVNMIMWEFTKKREADELVNWIEYAAKIIDLVEGKKGV